MKGHQQIQLTAAVNTLKSGGVIAYPTESCFGLGCDPKNPIAIEKVISIKSRSANKGLILIAASLEQAKEYIELDDSDLMSEILESWPGPNTWLLPAKSFVEPSLKGEFPLLAIRVTNHPIAKALCQQFGGAIVSTSANTTGQESMKTSEEITQVFADQVDTVVAGLIGEDAKPSTIRDGLTGEILRQ
jgi:L-threonylcarbamoyladenylate synthase